MMVVCQKCCIGELIEKNFSMERTPDFIITCDICDYEEDEWGRIR